MGRRRRQVAAAVSRDSSPTSAESSFRELDDVFLQNQTRIWLGEVLDIRLDEEMNISDVLADGELLFEVAKLVWHLLLDKFTELRHFKTYKRGPFASRRSSGRFRPYSNIDAFLKICKILGLNDIDLFCPSDVVEKRDTRKVCICIRALSKKARSKQLTVPDFDMVMYTVAMPTNMVGCIRRSLESSQCSISSSSSYSSNKGYRRRLQQKANVLPDRDYDSSWESDEAESKYTGQQPFSPTGKKSDENSGLSIDIKGSLGAHPSIQHYMVKPNMLQSVNKDKYTDESEPGWYKSQYDKSPTEVPSEDHQLESMSSYHLNSQESFYEASKTRRTAAVDLSDIKAAENDDSVVTDSSYEHVAQRDYISDYLAFSDIMVHSIDGNSPVCLNGEDNLFNFFLNIDPQESTFTKQTIQNGFQKKFLDDEEMEVCSTTSMSSVLGRVLSMDFDERPDIDDSSSVTLFSSGLLENESDIQGRDTPVQHESQCTEKSETSYGSAISQFQEPHLDMTPEKLEVCSKFHSLSEYESQYPIMLQEAESFDIGGGDPENVLGLKNPESVVSGDKGVDNLTNEHDDPSVIYSDARCLDPDISQCEETNIRAYFGSTTLDTASEGSISLANIVSADESREYHGNTKQHDIISTCSCEQSSDSFLKPSCQVNGYVSGKDPASVVEELDSAAEPDPQASSYHDKGTSYTSACAIQDEKQNQIVKTSAEDDSDGAKTTNAGLPMGKLGQKALLKKVAKGTAVFGVLFLLLHIRSSRGKTSKETKSRNQFLRFSGAKFSTSKQDTEGRVNGSYPAAKLKFGS